MSRDTRNCGYAFLVSLCLVALAAYAPMQYFGL